MYKVTLIPQAGKSRGSLEGNYKDSLLQDLENAKYFSSFVLKPLHPMAAEEIFLILRTKKSFCTAYSK